MTALAVRFAQEPEGRLERAQRQPFLLLLSSGFGGGHGARGDGGAGDVLFIHGCRHHDHIICKKRLEIFMTCCRLGSFIMTRH